MTLHVRNLAVFCRIRLGYIRARYVFVFVWISMRSSLIIQLNTVSQLMSASEIILTDAVAGNNSAILIGKTKKPLTTVLLVIVTIPCSSSTMHAVLLIITNMSNCDCAVAYAVQHFHLINSRRCRLEIWHLSSFSSIRICCLVTGSTTRETWLLKIDTTMVGALRRLLSNPTLSLTNAFERHFASIITTAQMQ